MEKFVQATQPEELKVRRVKAFENVLSDDTLYIMERARIFEHEARENPLDMGKKKKYTYARNLATRCRRRDRKMAVTNGKTDNNWLNLNDLWKLNNRLNKNKSSNTKGDFTADILCEAFRKLQVDGPPICAAGFNPHAPPIKLPYNQLFRIEPLRWEGTDKSESLKTIMVQSKTFTRGAGGLNKYTLGALPVTYQSVILRMVNTSLCQGKYLTEWKTNRTVAIPKKGDLSNTKNWRPITIQDSIAGYTEKAVAAQLANFLETNGHIIQEQHGFRKNVGCSTAYADLMHRVRIKNKKLKSAAIFVDAKNAFGTPSHASILKLLYRVCDPIAFRWFKTFLENRRFFVEYKGVRSKPVDLPPRGTPQGAGCSPILFSFVINGLKMALTTDICIILFADDLTLVTEGTTWREVEEKLQINMDKTANWMHENDIAISETKTVYIRFGKSDSLVKSADEFSLSCNNQLIEEVSEFKFLGIRINQTLSVEPQCTYVRQRLLQTQRTLLSMLDYGTKYELVKILQGLGVGIFSHGMDTMPLLPVRWYRKLQAIINKTIAIIAGLKQINNKFIPQSLVLKAAGMKSLFNTHKYLTVSRLNAIIITKKPPQIYQKIIPLIHYSNGDTYISSHWDTATNFDVFRRKREFFRSKKRGKKVPKMVLFPISNFKGISKSEIFRTFPYSVMGTFNALPVEIRSQLGFRSFKSEIKNYYNNECQHAKIRKSADLDVCSLCPITKFNFGPSCYVTYRARYNVAHLKRYREAGWLKWMAHPWLMDSLLYNRQLAILNYKRMPTDGTLTADVLIQVYLESTLPDLHDFDQILKYKLHDP